MIIIAPLFDYNNSKWILKILIIGSKYLDLQYNIVDNQDLIIKNIEKLTN